ncbi:MAG: hypothetical protein JSV21_07810 [Nitrospirota bacterium]|nr:MAG: hypothetical protein JSV21_07810 [Nitrospirota bacterium]
MGEAILSWICPKCNTINRDNNAIRCTCGHEIDDDYHVEDSKAQTSTGPLSNIDPFYSKQAIIRGNQLQVIKLVTASYQFIKDNILIYFNLIKYPLLTLIIIGLFILNMDFDNRKLLVFLFNIMLILLMIPAVTAWHRLIVIGKGNRTNDISYRISKNEWLYIKALLLISVIALSIGIFMALFVLPVAWGISESSGIQLYASLIKLIAWVIMFTLLCRFLLILPSSALGIKMRVYESSRAFKGNAIRFAIAYFIAVSIPEILSLPVGTTHEILLKGSGLNEFIASTKFLVALLLQMAFYTLSIGVISLAYKMLVYDRTIESNG